MVLCALNDKEIFNLQLIGHLSHNNNVEVRRILQDVDPKNLSDSLGTTLLHHAVIFDNAEITQYLIDRGCDVNAPDNRGITPLSFAVELKRTSIIKMLLTANADIFLRGQCKQSPLQAVLAPDSSHELKIIMMFLGKVKSDDSVATAKALLNAKCPLSRALLFKDPVITRYMLGGCSVNDVDQNNDTALHYAVRLMDLENLKLLVDWGADVNIVNNSLQTPLHLYKDQFDSGHKILRTLLDHGAPLYVRDSMGCMAITRMFGYGHRGTVKTLIEYNVDLRATNTDGSTLLHYAAYNKDPGVIQQFRGRNFDVNARAVRGETALWYAVENGNPESLKFLLDNGANTSFLDDNGYTAFFQGFYLWVDMKEEVKNCLKCIELFLQYGADFDCVDAHQETVFDYALASNSFVLTKPILEYVAMGEAIGKPVATNEIFLSKIDLHDKFRSHFEFSKMKIEAMKRVVIFENIKLFKFLKDDEQKLEKYARNQELVENLKNVMYRMRRSNLYFVKILRRRVHKAIKTAKLREDAAISFSKIEGLDENNHVIEKILTFLHDEDLRNICLMSSDR